MRTSTRWGTTLGILLVAGLLLAPQILAQNPTGTLVGRVSDSDGSALPGVTITVTSPNLQGSRTTQSGANGDYKLPFLPAGTYQATYELEGFATSTREVRLSAAQTQTSDIAMQLAEVVEEIVVTSNLETISETITAQTTYSQEEVEKLPISRTIEEAVQLAPGVHATGPDQNITISGAMSFENLFLVNGVVVNENLRGQALDLFIEDAIQETTTTTSGISAEYGRFTGGVVNVLTKSGGNDLSASLRVNFNNDDWRSETFLTTAEREDEINETFEATLGGALWKDRLWFFGAGRDRETSETRQTALTNITYPRTDEQQRIEGKLTLGITPSHNLIASYLEIDEILGARGFGTFISLDSLSDREDPQELKSANYTGILTSNFFVEAQYSERDLGIGIGSGGVQDLIDGTLMRNRGTAFRYHAPTFCGQCEDEQRNNENILAKGSYFLSTESAGTHDLSFGYDTFDDIRFAINHQTGSDFSVWSSDIIIDGNNEVFPVFASSTWIGWWAVFNLDLAQPTSFKTNSFYVNDSWQLNDKLSFNLGVRYDENDGTNSAGNTVTDDSKVSPRVGLSYDVKGDGDLVVNASYGTYVAALANSRADSTSEGGAIGLFLSSYDGPLINNDTSCGAAGTCTSTEAALGVLFDWYFANGGTDNLNDDLSNIPGLFYTSIPGVTQVIPSSLKSPSADEISVGFTKRLGRKGLFRADVVFREWEDFYSDRRDLTTGSVDTPSGPVDLAFVGNFGDSVLEREYIALDTQFRYRFTDRFTLAGVYTWSELEGNINGETGVNGPVSASPFDYPEYQDTAWSFPVGRLSADQTHKFRTWGIYDLFDTDHHSLNTSVLFSYFSGTPYGALGAVSTADIVGDIGYVDVQGDPFNYFFTARDAFETDDITRVDWSLNYSFRWNAFGKSMEVFIQPEILNLFNEEGTIEVNDDVFDATTGSTCPNAGANGGPGPCQAFNPFTETPVEGVHWRRGDDFGQAEDEDDDLQTPRTFRVSVGFRF